MDKIQEIITELIEKATSDNNVLTKEYFIEKIEEENQSQILDILEKNGISIIDVPKICSESDLDNEQFVKKYAGLDYQKRYLNELSKQKRLSSEEEYRLFQVVKKGRNAKKILEENESINSLSLEEIEQLNILVDKGKNAKDIIITSYSRFVFSIALSYVKAKGNIPLEDLIQSGFSGLITAFENFNIDRGNKLATFARFPIMNAIQEEIASLRNPIAVPKTAQYHRGIIMSFINKFVFENKRKPTYLEIAYHLGAKTKEEAEKLASTTIPNLIESSKPTVNMDAKINKDNSEEKNTYAHFIKDTRKSALEEMITEEKNNLLYKALDNYLNDREKYIIYRRFRLGKFSNQKEPTLEELGTELDLTRERVRQIEASALSKLKNCPELHKIFSYVS